MNNNNIDKIIYKWFEIKYQTYDRLEHGDSIYLYYVGEEYADFRICKKYKYIYYKWELYEEFSQIIDLHYLEFENFMIKWVGDTFGLKGFRPQKIFKAFLRSLKIPK